MPRERLIQSFARVEVDKNLDVWKTGDRILRAVTASVSQNQRASSCQVVLDDADGAIAEKYMTLSFKEGGIQGLPPEVQQAAAGLTSLPILPAGDVPSQIIAECRRQGVTDPVKIAFILAVVEGESSFNHNAYNDEYGRFGNYGGRGLGQITTRENYDKYGRRLGIDLVGNPSLAHRPDVSTYILVAGIREGWTGRGGLDRWVTGENTNLAEAYRAIQGGVWGERYTRFFRRWLAALPRYNAASSIASPTSQSTPVNLQTPSEVSNKGRVIKVQLGFTEGISEFNFLHTRTTTNDAGETTLSGQSVRWVLNRVKRNTAYKSITLRQLAEKVASSYGAALRMDGGGEKLDYVDQSGLTDYQLLSRECEWYGYIIQEDGGSLVIQRPKGTPSGFILRYRDNLDTYSIEDRASSQLEPIEGGLGSSSFSATPDTARQEAKFSLDTSTGQLTQSQITPERTGTTGEKINPAVATTAAEPSPLVREVTRRVKGLPAKFESPTTPALLRLKPDQSFSTEGFPKDLFNRVWWIDSVEHRYELGHLRTSLSVYTPMSVKVTQPVETAASATGLEGLPSGDWMHPVQSNTCGARCEFGYARGRLHAGIDYGGAAAATYDLKAATTGVVTFVGNRGGYGLCVEITRSDGWWCRYAHLSASYVQRGQQVTIGQVICRMGSSGGNYATHLHFEVRTPDGRAVNPRDVLPREGAPPMA